jgi:hypothetical protein
VASSLYVSFANQYSLRGGFSFPIVLVPRYKLSLYHTPIKPDLLGFPGIGIFACGLRDHQDESLFDQIVIDAPKVRLSDKTVMDAPKVSD